MHASLLAPSNFVSLTCRFRAGVGFESEDAARLPLLRSDDARHVAPRDRTWVVRGGSFFSFLFPVCTRSASIANIVVWRPRSVRPVGGGGAPPRRCHRVKAPGEDPADESRYQKHERWQFSTEKLKTWAKLCANNHVVAREPKSSLSRWSKVPGCESPYLHQSKLFWDRRHVWSVP